MPLVWIPVLVLLELLDLKYYFLVDSFRAARLQNEIAPEKLFISKRKLTNEGTKNAKDDPKQNPKYLHFKAPLVLLKNISPALF